MRTTRMHGKLRAQRAALPRQCPTCAAALRYTYQGPDLAGTGRAWLAACPHGHGAQALLIVGRRQWAPARPSASAPLLFRDDA